MTYRGQVKQGVVVFNPPAELPKGTEVEVRPAGRAPGHQLWPNIDPTENNALTLGSGAATIASLPKEDVSDWEK